MFQYNCPDTVWLVKHVVVDDDTYLENDINGNRYWRTEEITFGGIPYRRVVNAKSTPSRVTGNNVVTPATVLFRGMNPGATTATFRRIAYKRPTEISSQRVQHECPSPEAEQILMQATMSLIDAINDHKKQLAVTQYIENTLKPRYWSQLDMGEQGVTDFCVKRPF